MRIISGTAKGIRLDHPTWVGTRPMMDKVKESLFSVVQFILPHASILDLYAGTGALGIEAISRGASQCTFIDKSKRCTQLIKQNTSLARVTKQSSILTMGVEQFVERGLIKQYDIIFFMPPYAMFSEALLEKVGASINPDGVLITEWLKDKVLPEQLGDLQLFKKKEFGQTVVWFYEKKE